MKKQLLTAIVAVGLITLAGCSQNNNSSQKISSSVSAQSKKKPVKSRKKVSRTNLKIKINGHTVRAHLNNSSAARAFSKKLPTTLTFVDFPRNNSEKMADLNYSLSTKGMPSGHAGDKGTIGYWSPDRRIIFYYGHVDFYPGIHIIGKFDSKNYQRVISNMPNHTRVRITKVK
ncbi:hypothetical protein GCM10022297_15570 [Lactobacillus hamsteri]|uniref:Cyclophilin-like domain-containing protein n=1 Tax=Lactobacillus hamsteri DSM 5661 = JCM 6256 TaxID=1423754 RepID=A0A0R1YM07_9LACO|nr:cyclophilin-like fold protein [Lactobacillus hamsteri]KRM40726.1 hypothetical protein FC39_GL000210 [Lactobacillus hamsteri DSM 5661 = JCM 6256]